MAKTIVTVVVEGPEPIDKGQLADMINMGLKDQFKVHQVKFEDVTVYDSQRKIKSYKHPHYGG